MQSASPSTSALWPRCPNPAWRQSTTGACDPTGYGLGGPDEERPGFDVTAFFGRGAVTDTTTDPGEIAPNAASAQGDHTTGLALTVSILAALRLVDQTGEGQVVDASLLGTAAWTMATGPCRRRSSTDDNRPNVIAIIGLFLWPTGSEAATIVGRVSPICPRNIGGLVSAKPSASAICSSMIAGTLKSRFDNMPLLIDIIDELMAKKTMAEWSATPTPPPSSGDLPDPCRAHQ
ncbi:MAG: CoA transferase [Acidimicrobiales bacterium]